MSMVGNRVLVVLGGRVFFVSGTSAATPIGAPQPDHGEHTTVGRARVRRSAFQG